MLDGKRINEAEKNVPGYIEDGWLFEKHSGIGQYLTFFLRNAETSLLTANLLFEVSTTNEKTQQSGGKAFESYLWVVVTSYYAMFYASLALFAKQNIKVGEKLVHKVVADTLIAKFLKNKKLAQFIESYEENKAAALEIMGSEEKANKLVESFEFERHKRHNLQYELGAEAKQNLARTSLSRASEFVAEIRSILRE